MFSTTRYLITTGYALVVLWSLWVLYSNHLNPTRRTMARITGFAATVWVIFYIGVAAHWFNGDAAVYWSRFAHVPTIAALLLVIQNVQSRDH